MSFIFQIILISLAIILILSFITLLVLLLSLLILFITRVPYAPVPHKVISLIFDQLKLKKGQTFYDLGCGDGRMLIAAEKFGLKTKGYELSPIIYLKARWNIWRNKTKSEILLKNFFKTNLKEADIVFIFLVDKVLPRLNKQLDQQLKPGTRIVSYGFPLPNWQALKVVAPQPNNPKASKIYIYKK